MVNAINHVRLAVQDLDRSFSFYTGHLGLRPIARWYKGAYLVAGSDWICLSLDPAARNAPLPEYTHLALTILAEGIWRRGHQVARCRGDLMAEEPKSWRFVLFPRPSWTQA